jgi:hypothetical protein
MGEKGLMEEDWNDRSNWRKKIIHGKGSDYKILFLTTCST